MKKTALGDQGSAVIKMASEVLEGNLPIPEPVGVLKHNLPMLSYILTTVVSDDKMP